MKRPPEAVAYLNNDQAGKKTHLNVKDVSPIQDLLNRFQLLSFNIIQVEVIQFLQVGDEGLIMLKH